MVWIKKCQRLIPVDLTVYRSDKMSNDRRDREMHKATCADCGNECEVPFKPKEDRPVYCRECFQKHRNN